MSERLQDAEPIMDEETTKIGLLMETAHTHQTLAENALGKLKAHMHGLDAIVREEIRRTLSEELQEVSTESRRAGQALQDVRRAANLRMMVWSAGITTLCCAIALAIAWWVLPSRAKIEVLRVQRDELAVAVARLERHGGRVDLRRCGPTDNNGGRLCVRVDRKAPAYGPQGEYLIVKGY